MLGGECRVRSTARTGCALASELELQDLLPFYGPVLGSSVACRCRRFLRHRSPRDLDSTFDAGNQPHSARAAILDRLASNGDSIYQTAPAGRSLKVQPCATHPTRSGLDRELYFGTTPIRGDLRLF